MPFTLIKGKFYIVNKSPDGDSLKFKADKQSNWNKLDGRKVTLNKAKQAQLRFEAIDAPETHYNHVSQPEDHANAATDYLLKAVGFSDVLWGPTHGRVTSVKKDGLDGYILSRESEMYGRPVSFVFAGKINKVDGSDVFLNVSLLKKSLNYKLAAAGLVYPMYYEGLFYDLRNAITKAVKKARSKKTGMWKDDKSAKFTVTGINSIVKNSLIFPKLFRRLVSYLGKHTSVSGFKADLKKKAEEILLLTNYNFTHFDDVVYQNNKTIGLEVLPEEMVFKP